MKIGEKNGMYEDSCKGQITQSTRKRPATSRAQPTAVQGTCNTRNTHATHMEHTCNTHGTHMEHTWNAHATRMQHDTQYEHVYSIFQVSRAAFEALSPLPTPFLKKIKKILPAVSKTKEILNENACVACALHVLHVPWMSPLQ